MEVLTIALSSTGGVSGGHWTYNLDMRGWGVRTVVVVVVRRRGVEEFLLVTVTGTGVRVVPA